ncbi:hypothetical protein JK361_35455 [Streptomyces sp. 5-8]|uniref:Uncharacterized protein n=1 Tax=Streptomyces musisoli TaxID=2802280 RepID=A0ABS1PCC7_9ACTN|nr:MULTISPECIES: hypothetical protein [Streptomyces]MBL1109809.1 hypothetical protein [Streptomyces musisoli]MBY8845924.1 hypothetical protein [Streptomyces sp. SP2-10]
MREPRDRSPDRTELAHALQDLSSVERWAERAAADGKASPYAVHGPVDGPRFSVDTETVDGMHNVARIAPSPSDEAERAAMRSLVRSLLDLAGHESGPARTQVVLTPAGLRVVACSLSE